jgi:hypothetical protein
MTERPGIHHGETALDPAVQHAHEAPYEPPHESVEFDREIQYHQLIWMGVSLLLLAVVSGVLVFFLLRGFVTWREKGAEVAPVMPPPAAVGGPQLLARPERELEQAVRAEKERLASYGWVDQASGVAHISIERAIEIVAERGLPSRVPAAPTTPSPEPAAAASTLPVPAVSPPPPTPETPQ